MLLFANFDETPERRQISAWFGVGDSVGNAQTRRDFTFPVVEISASSIVPVNDQEVPRVQTHEQDISRRTFRRLGGRPTRGRSCVDICILLAGTEVWGC